MVSEAEESQTGSSEEAPAVNWDDLPPVETVNLPEPEPTRPDIKDVPAGSCVGCGQPIERKPGSRGRLPKYHEECRPLKAASSASPRVATGRRSTKATEEADQVIEMFKSGAVKACLMLSMVDRYDAFCIMVSLPQICENLHGVLLRYEGFRREMLALKGGGSVLALIITCLMCVLPIAAHHGLIPVKRATEVLVQAPFTLHQISQRLKEGEAALTELMREQLEEAARAAKAKAAQSGNR